MRWSVPSPPEQPPLSGFDEAQWHPTPSTAQLVWPPAMTFLKLRSLATKPGKGGMRASDSMATPIISAAKGERRTRARERRASQEALSRAERCLSPRPHTVS